MQRWSTAIQAGNAYSAILVRTSDRSDDWWRTRRLDCGIRRQEVTRGNSRTCTGNIPIIKDDVDVLSS